MIDPDIFTTQMMRLQGVFGGRGFDNTLSGRSKEYYAAIDDYVTDEDFINAISLLIREHRYGFPAPVEIIDRIDRVVRDKRPDKPQIEQHAGKKPISTEDARAQMNAMLSKFDDKKI